MAENKNSFVAYAEWDGIFSELPDDIAGKLIKHIFSYVNDRNPETDDFVIKAVFAPIKSALKRDLKKWEKSVKEKEDAGFVGSLKRWNKPLYERVLKKELTIEEAKKIAKDSTPIGTHSTPISEDSTRIAPDKQRVAKIAVNEHVYVNVNDNDKEGMYDGKGENEKNHHPIKPSDLNSILPDQKIKIENAIEILKSPRCQSWREFISMKQSITVDEMILRIDLFHDHCRKQGKFETTYKDLQQHFLHWTGKGLHNPKQQTQNGSTQTTQVENNRPGEFEGEILNGYIWNLGGWRFVKNLTKAQIRTLEKKFNVTL